MIQALRRIRALTLLTLSCALFACGGDDASTSASNPGMTISGQPLPSVLQGTTYSFTPSASSAQGRALTFSVANLPGWATFDTSTGQVSGAPTSAHLGTYSNITLSVSDGAASATLAPFSIQVVATATGSALLTWTPPTQNSDGSALTNLAGYRIYWGTSRGSYTRSVTLDNPGLTSYLVEQLTPATWYFALTAVNSAGVESSLSSAASKVIR